MQLSMKTKVIITFTYFLSTLLSYSVMLVVMSFNGGLFLATVFGLSFGFFIFGYLKKKGHAASKAALGDDKIYNPEGDKCCADVDFD
jgi:Ctr copper transporter family